MTLKLAVTTLLALGALGAVFGSTGCGKKDDGVIIEIIPVSPVVISADLKLPDPNPENDIDESVSVPAPWFQFRMAIQNNSSKPITIVNLLPKYTGTKDGQTVTGEGDGFEVETYIVEVAAGGVEDLQTIFYVHSLPEVDGYKYTVTIDVQGWIGSYTNPEQRLDKKINLKTQ